MKAIASGKSLGFLIIGGFKLASAVLLAAAGMGIFHLVGGDVGAALGRSLSRLRLDPENQFIHTAIANVARIDRRQLKQLGIGTFIYAALHLVEGVGLLLRRRWAGYLTVLITGSLIPLEGYEVARKPGAAKVAVLVVNVGIVVYLIVKLRQERRTSVEPAEA